MKKYHKQKVLTFKKLPSLKQNYSWLIQQETTPHLPQKMFQKLRIKIALLEAFRQI
jgi:hypothetical protein